MPQEEPSQSHFFPTTGLPSAGPPLKEVDDDITPSERINAADDDVSDTDSDVVSDLSCASCLSDTWKPISGPIFWIQNQITMGTSPRDILKEILPDASIPMDLDNLTLWRLIVDMLSEPPKRRKLPNYNTIDDVVELIKTKKNIVVLCGAGVS